MFFILLGAAFLLPLKEAFLSRFISPHSVGQVRVQVLKNASLKSSTKKIFSLHVSVVTYKMVDLLMTHSLAITFKFILPYKQANCFLGLGYDWKYSFCSVQLYCIKCYHFCIFHMLLTHFFPPFQHLLSERLRLSDSKCWNIVAKTQRWEQMG